MEQDKDYTTVAGEIISGKWTLLVISVLQHDTLRYGVIQRAIPDITQRALTLTLQRLERNSLVARTSYSTIPPQVEYKLTSLGLELLEVVTVLNTWAKKHGAKIRAAQDAYDQQLGQ